MQVEKGSNVPGQYPLLVHLLTRSYLLQTNNLLILTCLLSQQPLFLLMQPIILMPNLIIPNFFVFLLAQNMFAG
jgi:hypothetical protein